MTEEDYKAQLDFYQQVYTIQKAYHKHFHWTYSMSKTRFGVWIPDEIKKQKKKVRVNQSALNFINYTYQKWCLENNVQFELMVLPKVNK